MTFQKSTGVLFLACLLLLLTISHVEATFSIVAIDTVTHEIGVAAASCVPGGIIADIFHVEPNVGGFIPQAHYNPENRDKGIELIRQNKSAMEIVEELVMSDESAVDRQYGVITVQGGTGCFFGTSMIQFGSFSNSTLQPGIQCTAFTGNNNFDWAGHIVGRHYTIHGNILSGKHILEDMEHAFLTTDGALPIKLMAALQAAKQVGADSRCDTTSSLCAAIKVGRPTDSVDSLMLNINVTNVEGDPIDSLQAEFDRLYPPPEKLLQKATTATLGLLRNYPNPFNPSTTIEFECHIRKSIALEVYDILGQKIKTLVNEERMPGRYTVIWNSDNDFGEPVSAGIYIARLVAGEYSQNFKLSLIR
jgi:uncharacterized Ntn-hydrolase superfamily protein